MTGLLHTLGTGSNALLSSRQGLDTTAHNIANAHTEGYSRQEAEVVQRQHSVRNGLVMGNGSFVKNIKR